MAKGEVNAVKSEANFMKSEILLELHKMGGGMGTGGRWLWFVYILLMANRGCYWLIVRGRSEHLRKD